MGNTVPPRASSREATVTGRWGVGTGGRRPQNVVTEVAPPATPSRVVTAARKQGRDDDDDGEDVEEEETARAGRPRAGKALWAAGADGVAPAPAAAGKVLTLKIVMRRKNAEALVARLKAQGARERKARMAELKGELRAGSCGGGGACRDVRRPMLPPIKEDRFERTPVV